MLKKNKMDPITSKKLKAVDSLCGLNTSEIAEASTGSNETTEYPTWIAAVLFIIASIAISWSFIMWRNATYTPGTWYASLSPKDFNNAHNVSRFQEFI
ncbi:MAG: hypothetical protein P1Q69_08385 [Candidatus Thorarchaeota archaeon]|nr:hypothetical protein [Candidatus Thorarchaeota archaeon]